MLLINDNEIQRAIANDGTAQAPAFRPEIKDRTSNAWILFVSVLM
jgi:hypothetical protein